MLCLFYVQTSRKISLISSLYDNVDDVDDNNSDYEEDAGEEDADEIMKMMLKMLPLLRYSDAFCAPANVNVCDGAMLLILSKLLINYMRKRIK